MGACVLHRKKLTIHVAQKHGFGPTFVPVHFAGLKV
jgi:hypothetical protein